MRIVENRPDSRHSPTAVTCCRVGCARQSTSRCRGHSPPYGQWHLLAAGLLLAAAGCWGDSKPPAKSTASSAAGNKKEADQQCEAVLVSIEDIFQIQRLGRTTSVSDGVSRLNDWQSACAPATAGAGRELPAEVKRLFADDQLAALAATLFLRRDGEHFRNCILERAISGYVLGAPQTELEKVTNLFGHIIRAVGLVPRPLHDLPLTPYDIYLLGKGTAEDRAWIFVNVLRQLKIDAILLFPASAGDDAAPAASGGPFLVGVLLDGKVYLFDPRYGLPIQALEAGAAAPAASGVATLAEAASDPAVLKQLDAGSDRPYPIRAADLSHPVVAIVGDSSLWSARMESLQTQFVGNRALVISDPLADAPGKDDGAWTRVVKAGGDRWGGSQLRLWEYPEVQLTAHLKMTKHQQESLEGLMKPFEAFMNVVPDPRNGQLRLVEREAHEDPAKGKFDAGVRINIRTTKGEQMRVRLDQLAGDFTQAVKGYVNVRLRCKDVLGVRPGPAETSIHTRAIDDATFWTALCQFEQGEFEAAANTLDIYRKRADPGNWMRESRYLLALSRAASGDRAAAIRELEAVEPDDPEYAGYRVLIRRWQNPDGKR
jgi:hypothetical protein